MNQAMLIRQIARRLPSLKRREVAAVLEVLVELWQVELSRPGGHVTLTQLGKLEVEVQALWIGGAAQAKLRARHGTSAPRVLQRVYVRFRPTAAFRQAILAGHAMKEERDET